MFPLDDGELTRSERRTMVNWKEILTFFILNEAPVPQPMELEAYRERIEMHAENGEVSLEGFLKVTRFVNFVGSILV